MMGWIADWRKRREERVAAAKALDGPEECPRTVTVGLAVSTPTLAELDRLTRTGLYGETSGETARALLLERLREVTGK